MSTDRGNNEIQQFVVGITWFRLWATCFHGLLCPRRCVVVKNVLKKVSTQNTHACRKSLDATSPERSERQRESCWKRENRERERESQFEAKWGDLINRTCVVFKPFWMIVDK